MSIGTIIIICVIAYIMIGAFIGELLVNDVEEMFLIMVGWPAIVIAALIGVIAFVPRLLAIKLKEKRKEKRNE